jgi:hypothetical protein
MKRKKTRLISRQIDCPETGSLAVRRHGFQFTGQRANSGSKEMRLALQ